MMRFRALGVYEYWKTKLFMDLIKPGMTLIDVGVNKGYYSLLGANLMNDTGKILSFEPDLTNCHWIKKSIEANKYKSIKLFQTALSDKTGSATFYPGKISGWGSLYFTSYESATNTDSITINTRKLDEVLNDEGINKIDIIKIDVEGSAPKVLEGAKDILKKSKNVKLILDLDIRDNNKKEVKKQSLTLLYSLGFQIYNIGKRLEKVKYIDDAGKDLFAIKTEA